MTKKNEFLESKSKIPNPIAVAIWLVDNTILTAEQISDFCDISLIEIESIFDGFLGKNTIPVNPIAIGILDQESIKASEKDSTIKLERIDLAARLNLKRRYKDRLSRFQTVNKINAILWFINFYPNIEDKIISKILRTNSDNVVAVRERRYKNQDEMQPKDPVILGFISQIDLNNLIEKYNNN